MRDLKWFDSLSQRDLQNGAVTSEIRNVFKEADKAVQLKERLFEARRLLEEMVDLAIEHKLASLSASFDQRTKPFQCRFCKQRALVPPHLEHLSTCAVPRLKRWLQTAL